MSGDVEALPPVAAREAFCLVEHPRHVADARVFLNHEKDAGEAVPDAGGDGDPHQLPLDDGRVAAAVGVAGDKGEGSAKEQSPAPGKLDEVDVERVVRAGEVMRRLGREVADDAQDEDANYVYADLTETINIVDIAMVLCSCITPTLWDMSTP